jgi:hypothetical protein
MHSSAKNATRAIKSNTTSIGNALTLKNSKSQLKEKAFCLGFA